MTPLDSFNPTPHSQSARPTPPQAKTHTDAAIEVRDLCVSYKSVPAIAQVSLSQRRGKVLAVIGPSGCGKSTFLHSLNRLSDLIPGCSVTGEIRIGDIDVRAPRCDVLALRRRVGMIFQRANPFPLSIETNIELALKEHGMRDRGARRQRVESSLRDVGLWDEVCDRLDHPAQQLSGGQQQRLCIARALALDPEVLLMDEPCSALDPNATQQIEELILRLRGRFTVVVVTHNLAQARRIADDAALFWLRDGIGHIVESGSASQIFDSPTESTTSAYVRGQRG